jgi:hypothetical protein
MRYVPTWPVPVDSHKPRPGKGIKPGTIEKDFGYIEGWGGLTSGDAIGLIGDGGNAGIAGGWG